MEEVELERLKAWLREQYLTKISPSQCRAVGAAEVKLWNALVARHHQDGALAQMKQLGLPSQRDLSSRQVLINNEARIQPLWDLLEQGYCLTAVRQLYTDSQAKAKAEGDSFTECLKQSVSEYLALPTLRFSDSGRFRCKSVNARVPVEKDGVYVTNGDFKKTKAAIIELALTYLKKNVRDFDDSHLQYNSFAQRVATEIGVVLEDLTKETVRARMRLPSVKVTRSVVVDACDQLGVPSPYLKSKSGDGYNYALARKKYRTLSARYHADVNPGDQKAKIMFKAIQDAWEVIEQYEESTRE